MQNNYSEVAGEYYDEQLHPTSANLGYASISLITRIREVLPKKGVICEIGAGRSELPNILTEIGSQASIILTDGSAQMLAHSRLSYGDRVQYFLCNAENLPFEPASIDFVVSLLGDPYNSGAFWLGVQNVLREGGKVFFTTPSWEWAKTFRMAEPRERASSAFFVNARGESLYMPSEIFPEQTQSELMAKFGFLVQSIHHFTLSDLKASLKPVSPKIGSYLSDATPVVTGFLAEKVAPSSSTAV